MLLLMHPLQIVSLTVHCEEWRCFACCLTVYHGAGLLCLGVHNFWPCSQNRFPIINHQAGNINHGNAAAPILGRWVSIHVASAWSPERQEFADKPSKQKVAANTWPFSSKYSVQNP